MWQCCEGDTTLSTGNCSVCVQEDKASRRAQHGAGIQSNGEAGLAEAELAISELDEFCSQNGGNAANVLVDSDTNVAHFVTFQNAKTKRLFKVFPRSGLSKFAFILVAAQYALATGASADYTMDLGTPDNASMKSPRTGNVYKVSTMEVAALDTDVPGRAQMAQRLLWGAELVVNFSQLDVPSFLRLLPVSSVGADGDGVDANITIKVGDEAHNEYDSLDTLVPSDAFVPNAAAASTDGDTGIARSAKNNRRKPKYHQSYRGTTQADNGVDIRTLSSDKGHDAVFVRPYNSELKGYVETLNLAVNKIPGETVAGSQLMDFREDLWLHTTSLLVALFVLRDEYPDVGIIHPSFNQFAVPEQKRRVAGGCGASDPKYKRVVGVLNINLHWVSFLIDRDNEVCYMFDPLQSDSNYKIIEKRVRQVVAELLELGKKLLYGRISWCKQQDSGSCGVWCLAVLEMLITNAKWDDSICRLVPYLHMRYLYKATAYIENMAINAIE
ncbi:hypothetical protein ON010_g1369 [Phytophthora cinnamomi]|nr:hypothetical protein ON010_g1369 [Phytophthora cinnamomi]